MHSTETVDFICSECKKIYKKENAYNSHILKCNVDITDGVDITQEVDAAENYADITSISMISQYFGLSNEDDGELPMMGTLEVRINH